MCYASVVWFVFVFLVKFLIRYPLVYIVFVLSFVIFCLHAKLRIYEAMDGKSHDMSFCVGVQIRQWNSSATNKTYPQDVGIGRC